MSGLGKIAVDLLLLALLAVIGEEYHLVIDHGLKMGRALPDTLNVLQRFDQQPQREYPLQALARIEPAEVRLERLGGKNETCLHQFRQQNEKKYGD